MAYTDKALMAHMKSGLHGGLGGLNVEVADITEADTNKHTITLAEMGLPSNVRALILCANKISGTGNFLVYPQEGATYVEMSSFHRDCQLIFIHSYRLEYSLSVAGDNFKLYCFGYFTQGQVLG